MLTDIKIKFYRWQIGRASQLRDYPKLKKATLAILDTMGAQLTISDLLRLIHFYKTNNLGLTEEQRADLVVEVWARVHRHPMTAIIKMLDGEV